MPVPEEFGKSEMPWQDIASSAMSDGDIRQGLGAQGWGSRVPHKDPPVGHHHSL